MPAWLGGPELVVIVLVIVIVFGWKKLPDAARSLGRSMRIFKAEVDEMKREPNPASRDTVEGTLSKPGEASAQGEHPGSGAETHNAPSTGSTAADTSADNADNRS